MLLAFLGVLGGSFPARADFYSAQQDYQKRDYARAFEEFMALAQLGQPVAQLDVAIMYQAGLGVEASDIHAYAWASLAAQNGEPKGKQLADFIRPRLAPGSEGISGWLTSAYMPDLLEENLLPDFGRHGPFLPCKMVRFYNATFPEDARRRGIDGNVLVDFTVMPDGTARFPRIITRCHPDCSLPQ